MDLSLFNLLDDFYFLLDTKGNILFANDAVFNKLGFNRQDLKELDSILSPESILKIEHSLITCGSSGEKTQTECRITNAAKNDIIECRATFNSVSNGEVLLQLRDITQTKKDKLNLTRFKYIADHTMNALQITDLTGRMIYVNPAYSAESGFDRDELIGLNPKVFGSGKLPASHWEDVWKTISAGKTWIGEVENRRKNGEIFYSQLQITPMSDENGNPIGYFGIHRDLADKRNLEKQLIHTQKMESIGTLAAGVAHEVGNPLASISALAQIIQRSTEDGFIIEKLELIRKQITRISKIIRDLVDFSRPSNYELKSTDIGLALREAIEIVMVGKKAKDISFNFNYIDGFVIPLVSDQIQQVFVNILINAIDALTEMKEKFPDHKGKISAETFVEGSYLVVELTDNGPGIPADKHAKIFEPFFTTKAVGKGTGLGLWVSYGIVKSFQGEIKVESKPGKGTTFKISLPLNPIY
ncbi:MAG: PAS domain S-box protein [Ignavibacteriales bacterium]|nr:MAG: PAS domain S-box protein [Ignavibacteriaceae bacterium]MBV6445095.1 Adaptive-response sensory-kinase SasA [Ignavibacteriaceae bacterium]MBW7872518.1 PAS domain S-box protein [Ignavibacteria bacterium]MBZ0196788.1 PAS domain S-box protein [Ignavibacteriaceae bacterium]MCZ2141929.1 PAS domain S-box protein [Ignavibacteriales bacterium]